MASPETISQYPQSECSYVSRHVQGRVTLPALPPEAQNITGKSGNKLVIWKNGTSYEQGYLLISVGYLGSILWKEHWACASWIHLWPLPSGDGGKARWVIGRSSDPAMLLASCRRVAPALARYGRPLSTRNWTKIRTNSTHAHVSQPKPASFPLESQMKFGAPGVRNQILVRLTLHTRLECA